MSLINDALKKAQRQRTEADAPAAPVPDATGGTGAAEPLQRVARREKPRGFQSQLLLVGGGVVVVTALVVAGIFFFGSSSGGNRSETSNAMAAVKPPAPAVAPTPQPAPAVAATAAAAPEQSKQTPAPTASLAGTEPAKSNALPSTEAQNSSIAPAPSQVSPPSAASPVPAVSAQVVAANAEPAATAQASAPKSNERPKPSTHMMSVIDGLKVMGIRAAGAESKVLMNDRVYRLNDVVDHELNIRLTGVAGRILTFEDDRGAVYSRSF
jgi:cytoskeletal protein RodZ